MKNLTQNNIMQNKKIIRLALAVVFILLIPLIAMQFTDEVNWDLADFVIAGVLLFGAGFAYELIARKGSTTAYRAAVGVAVAAALLLLWVNGAVGIIGSEDNPANLLYGAVLATLIIGAVTARSQPRGMTRTLFLAALVQLLVPVFALTIWPAQASGGEAGVVGVFILNAFFVILWIVSALLFRKAIKLKI
jgi:hypothetical protein